MPFFIGPHNHFFFCEKYAQYMSKLMIAPVYHDFLNGTCQECTSQPQIRLGMWDEHVISKFFCYSGTMELGT